MESVDEPTGPPACVDLFRAEEPSGVENVVDKVVPGTMELNFLFFEVEGHSLSLRGLGVLQGKCGVEDPGHHCDSGKTN